MTCLALLLAACSGTAAGPGGAGPGKPGNGDGNGGGNGGGEPVGDGPKLAPAPVVTVGDLDGCDPAGTWIGEGAAQGTGTCTDAAPAVRLEVVIKATGVNKFEARKPDGSPLQLERIRGAAGVCELDVEEMSTSATGPNLVVFYHLADAGTGLAVRDEYEGGAEFKPETGKIRCTEGYDLAVKREAKKQP
jgi:hypothetical protein